MKLFQRSNGYWYVRLSRNKIVSLRTKDKYLAEKVFYEIVGQSSDGKIKFFEDYDKKTLLKDFFNEYLKWAETHKAYTSVERDKYAFKSFLRFFPENKKLKSVTKRDLERYRSFLLKSGRKPTGINVDFRSLKAAFNKAKEWGYIKESPFKNFLF